MRKEVNKEIYKYKKSKDESIAEKIEVRRKGERKGSQADIVKKIKKKDERAIVK